MKSTGQSSRQDTEAAQRRAAKIADWLKDAKKLMSAKDYAGASALYLKCVRALSPHVSGRSNLLAYYYSLAYYANMLQKRVIVALRYWQLTHDYLEPDTDYAANTFIWLFNSLSSYKSAARTKAAKEQIALCQKQCLKAMGNIETLLQAGKVDYKPLYYLKHKTKVADPYAYLELLLGPDANQKVVLHKWIREQVSRSQMALGVLRSQYTLPQDFYKAGWAQTKKLPYLHGTYVFQSETRMGTHHTVLRRCERIGMKGKVILDTAKLLKDDELFAGFRINRKGNRLLWGVSKKGSDLTTWRVRDIETGKDVGAPFEKIIWGSIYFHSDGKGIVYQTSSNTDGKRGLREPFYYRLPPAKPAGVIFHQAIDPQASTSYPSSFGKKVLVSESYSHSFNNRVYIKNASLKSRAKPLEIFAGRPGDYRYVGWRGQEFFFYTHYKAPRGRVIAVRLNKQMTKVLGMRDLIEQGADNMTSVHLLKSCILVLALVEHGRRQVLLRYGYDGTRLGEIPCPNDGVIGSISRSYSGNDIYFYASSKASPATIYVHTLSTGKTRVYAGSSFKPDLDIKTETAMVRSQDGTLVPLHISYRADLRPGKRTPCLMSVYGGFGVNMTTGFSYQAWSWIESGGIWAQPYLRGGQELGKDWHQDATVSNKHKTFEDAEACALYLIDKGMTSSKKLALQGGSNGGLTVAALLNRHPELYGAAILNNGLLDMLKFQTHSNGWSWLKEYGSVERRADFDYLKSYSPYHNIAKNKDYPALLLCVSMDDDRVPPWHSFKYAAMLTHKLGAKARFLMRLEYGTGHANSKPSNLVEDELAFLHHVLKLGKKPPKEASKRARHK